MSKFFEILEQHDPANQSKMDAAFQAKFFLYEQEVPFSSEGSKIILHADQGDIILEAVRMQAKEVEDEDYVKMEIDDDEDYDDSNLNYVDEEEEYDIDTAVGKLADKKALKLDIGGPGALNILKARRLKKKRDNVAVKALNTFDKSTKELENAVKSAKTKTFNVT